MKPNHYGVQGFETAAKAREHAERNTTADDYMILHNTSCADFAWVWPPEYGRTLISETIVEVAK